MDGMETTFGGLARAALEAAGMSLREAARQIHYDPSYLSRVLAGRQSPSPGLARDLDALLATGGRLAAAAKRAAPAPAPRSAVDDELAALELVRRVSASDVGEATVAQLEGVVDDLAVAYPATPPRQLLDRVSSYSGYVAQLLDARATLVEQRRLLVVAGWLSLLAATLHIDLAQDAAATARLQAAATLAREAGHPEIVAWCRETEAWRLVTRGRYVEAAALSQAAQLIAPAGSSALIQAAAQEGRARARLGQQRETRAVIDRVQALSDAAGVPERPDHHYRYDPTKARAYVATTLAWAGDPAAEGAAREVITHLGDGPDPAGWSRRTASAHIDLARALVAADILDEAAHAAQLAITSGRIVPSNQWRAAEIVDAIDERGVGQGAELREAFAALTAAPEAWGSDTAASVAVISPP